MEFCNSSGSSIAVGTRMIGSTKRAVKNTVSLSGEQSLIWERTLATEMKSEYRPIMRTRIILNNTFKPPFYFAIRSMNSNEILGITIAGKLHQSRVGIGISQVLIVSLTEAIGNDDWWFDNIPKAEFETYQAFGFKEYTVDEE